MGFLTYYQVRHLVFILFGAPSILTALLSLSNPHLRQSGLTLSYYLLLSVTIIYSNVQSSARFFSSHPVYSINLAVFLMAEKGQTTWLQRFVLFYIVLYNVAGVLLFPVRFPWT